MWYNKKMNIGKPYLSIIIPAYNERERIGSTLKAVAGFIEKQSYSAEILVVSDGSTDKTVEIAESARDHISSLRVIENKENHGKGWVVRQGMLEAQGGFRLFTDADNATPIEEFEKLLGWVKPQGIYDIAIGSIGLKESKVDRPEPLPRVIAGRMANFLIQTVAVPGIQDTQRGFKLFTAESAEAIFSKTKIDRWGFDIEVLALARKLGFTVKEVPIRWIHMAGSKVKADIYYKTLAELAKIRWWLWTNSYGIRRN